MTFRLILRSACVGLAGSVAVAFVAGFVALSLFAMNTPMQSGEPEAGWDMIAMTHNHLVPVIAVLLAVFVIGFLIGFRYFSKRQHRQGG